MSELRWILLLIGVLIVAGVYGYTRYQRHLRDEASFGRRGAQRDVLDVRGDEPVISSTEEMVDASDLPPIEFEPGDGEAPGDGGDAGDDTAAGRRDGAAPEKAREILILHIRAAEGGPWPGEAVARAAESAGLKQTDKKIFQYFSPESEQALFHVADMFKPGVFDWQRLGEARLRGLSLFMQLPVHCPAPEAFETMLNCARRLAESLGGEMLDARRQPLTEEALADMRALCGAHDGPQTGRG